MGCEKPERGLRGIGGPEELGIFWKGGMVAGIAGFGRSSYPFGGLCNVCGNTLWARAAAVKR